MSAPDRDLMSRILAIIPVIADRVGVLLTAANENPQLREQLAAAVAERDAARAENSADAQADADALTPAMDALDALQRLVTPAAAEAPDVEPVTAIEDVPAVADGDLPADSTDGRTDAPTSGEINTDQG